MFLIFLVKIAIGLLLALFLGGIFVRQLQNADRRRKNNN